MTCYSVSRFSLFFFWPGPGSSSSFIAAWAAPRPLKLTVLAFYDDWRSLFFFLRPASSSAVARTDPVRTRALCWSGSSTSRLTSRRSFQQYKTAHDSYSTQQPFFRNYLRREDYLRLPFVDDLRLRGAMQGFLLRDSSHEARLTRRRFRPSKCQRCHSEKILPFVCHLLMKLT